MRFRTADALSFVDAEGLCRSLLSEFGASNITLRGDELWCSCPLPFGLHAHGDRNPSFSVNVEKLTASCFVCGGGSLAWFVAVCRGTSVHQARGWLAGQGDLDDEASLSNLLTMLDALYGKPESPPPIPHMNPQVLEPWRLIHPYLIDRGVPEETIIAQQVGYDPDKARVVIPHWWRGQLTGWQSRRVVDDGTPKYLSTPGFAKDRTLYHAPESLKRVVVVESPMSVLRHLHHVPHLVATFGASVTDRQVSLLARYDEVTLWFDNDSAGWKGAGAVVNRLAPHTNVWMVESPFVQDAGDLSDEMVEYLLAECRVPYSVWEQPVELLDAGALA